MINDAIQQRRVDQGELDVRVTAWGMAQQRILVGDTVQTRRKAQNDWKLDLPTPDADVPVRMAHALWVGQESRHGGNGYRKPTQAEAEAAVLLAVSLVQWFASGPLARRP